MPNKKLNTLFPKNIAAPLLCWDIFMEGYWKKMALAEDKMEIEKISKKYFWQHRWNLESKLLKEGKVVVITDPSLHIVFASSNILDMSGYTNKELIGKTPKIFQGKNTDVHTRTDIRRAVKELRNFDVTLINYKKNGEPYQCNIEGFPVFNKEKKLVHFIAFEAPGVYEMQ